MWLGNLSWLEKILGSSLIRTSVLQADSMCPLRFIFLVRRAFLYCSFKSNSPLTRGVYLIFRLVTIRPWMVSLSLG